MGTLNKELVGGAYPTGDRLPIADLSLPGIVDLAATGVVGAHGHDYGHGVLVAGRDGGVGRWAFCGTRGPPRVSRIDRTRGITYNTTMEPYGVVIDTNVLVSALRSRTGASFRVLELLGSERFEIQVSVPLVLEYEAVARRVAPSVGLSEEDVGDILDYLCRVASRRTIFFLWRPFLKDPKDDHVLELAVEAQCEFIVTHNVRDFAGVEQFGLRAITPREFLSVLGEVS